MGRRGGGVGQALLLAAAQTPALSTEEDVAGCTSGGGGPSAGRGTLLGSKGGEASAVVGRRVVVDAGEPREDAAQPAGRPEVARRVEPGVGHGVDGAETVVVRVHLGLLARDDGHEWTQGPRLDAVVDVRGGKAQQGQDEALLAVDEEAEPQRDRREKRRLDGHEVEVHLLVVVQDRPGEGQRGQQRRTQRVQRRHCRVRAHEDDRQHDRKVVDVVREVLLELALLKALREAVHHVDLHHPLHRLRVGDEKPGQQPVHLELLPH